MRNLVPAWLLAIVFCLLAPLAQAQIPGLAGQQPVPTVPASLANPRATMRTFLTGMNETRIKSAISALDLSEISAFERGERGSQLAFQLWAILNREVYIRYEDIPSSTTAPDYVLPITSKTKRQIGQVVIDQGEDGAYRFTPATLADLDRMWELVKDKPVITGLDDPDPKEFAPAQWLEGLMPEDAKARILGIPQWKWIFLGMVILFAAAAAWVIKVLTQILLCRILKLRKTDPAYKGIARAGFGLSVFVLSCMVAADYTFLGLPSLVAGIVAFVGHMGQVVGAVLFAFAIWDGVVDLYTRRVEDKTENAERLVAPVISRLGKALILVVAGISLLTFFGINVTGLVATLGIGGLVIAFAAKDSVENLFGSIMVLIEKPFRIGDWIRVDNVDGEVEEIRLRSTRVRTFEDSVIVVPNSMLVTKSVENYGMRRYRRLRTTIQVMHDTPPEKLEQFTDRVRVILEKHPQVWEEKRVVHLNDFGEGSLKILLNCFLMAPTWKDEMQYRDEILTSVVKAAHELGIGLAHPEFGTRKQ